MRMGMLASVAAVVVLSVGGVARAADDAVKVEKTGKGSYLTDGKGMALYVFKNDSKGQSTCTGQCVTNWPLFQAENVKPEGEGVKAEDFATITRGDGQKQTTYKGMPLYYFIKDEKPGDTKGQGVKDVWFLAMP